MTRPAPFAIMPAPAAQAGPGLSDRTLSPSQVSTFIDCQARWYYSRIAKLPEPATAAQAFGKAIHHVCRLILAARMDPDWQAKSALTAGEIGDCFRSTLKIELQEVEDIAGAADMLDEGLRIMAMFAGQIGPQLEPTGLEMWCAGEIGGVKVRGCADVLTADQVIDLKTSKANPHAISASYQLQLITYCMLSARRSARLVTMARTKVPSWNQHTLTLTPAHTQYAATMYSMAAEGMQSGLYLPNRGSNLCSRRNCAFWGECQKEYGGIVPE